MSNNVVNPLLYAWLNPTFRKLVVATIFGNVGKRGTSRQVMCWMIVKKGWLRIFFRIIRRPWIYRSLPPRSQTEKLNDLHGPITSETLIGNATPKLKGMTLRLSLHFIIISQYWSYMEFPKYTCPCSRIINETSLHVSRLCSVYVSYISFLAFSWFWKRLNEQFR